MIRRLLIANRGEIAVRVARAAREAGIVPLGMYSDADASAVHRRAMDESARIGPPPASESYLNIAAILAAGTSLRADAVHPGYGFLAENAGFAQAVRDAGMTFVGPPSEAIAAMGSKIEAKRLVRARGVPTVPGYDDDDRSAKRLRKEAEKIGTPVLIKASAGGGGRGMRIVEDLATFDEALAAAKREAQSAFGDDRVLLEKYLRSPRHIEIQVLADAHGAIVHLGERECSIQRRHQKIVEEAPSTAVDAELRARMGEAAVAAARAVGYVNAGTVEFMLDAERNFYFLEMNTRIQVEHPVTELVYGIDLVRAQLEIADGAPLALEQSALIPRGWAIEARLYAEDPVTFLPSSGKLLTWVAPQGPGVRVDSGVEAGSEVGVWYDPMLAKIIAWGGSREAALARLAGALAETQAAGVRTNLPLLQWIAGDEAFRSGATTTNFLTERLGARGLAQAKPSDEVVLRAAAAALRRGVSWRLGSVEVPLDLTVEGTPFRLRASALGAGRWRIEGDVAREIDLGQIPDAPFALVEPPRADAHAHASEATDGSVIAPMPGKIVSVAVREGEEVDERALLLVLEAMKMEHRIEAPLAGTVREIRVAPGALVAAGERLVTIG